MSVSSTEPSSGDSDNIFLLRWSYYLVDGFNTAELKAFCDFLWDIVLVHIFIFLCYFAQDTALFLFVFH